MKFYFLKIFLVTFVVLMLVACNSPIVYSSPPLPDSTSYMVDGIENSEIQVAWLEAPIKVSRGTEYVRLFLAKNNPPSPIIPNPNNLRCTLTSDSEFGILGPEMVLFEFFEDGSFNGSYTYRACPDCIECYMNWDYTLELNGFISEGIIFLDIDIIHFGHNVKGSYQKFELMPIKGRNKEPRMKCNRLMECTFVELVTVR